MNDYHQTPPPYNSDRNTGRPIHNDRRQPGGNPPPGGRQPSYSSGGRWEPPGQPQQWQQPPGWRQPQPPPQQPGQPFYTGPYHGWEQPPCQPSQPYCREPWQPYTGKENRSNGIGTAGFILALISIFVGWFPFLGWLIWILGAVFSFIGLFRQPRGLAIAGVIISLVLIPMLVTLLVALDTFTSAMFLM